MTLEFGEHWNTSPGVEQWEWVTWKWEKRPNVLDRGQSLDVFGRVAFSPPVLSAVTQIVPISTFGFLLVFTK